MVLSASRFRSREKTRSRSRKEVKSSSRSRSKTRKPRKENYKISRTSSRSRASPSFTERKRKVSGFSDNSLKTVKSPSSPENSGTSPTLQKSQGLQPRSKSPVEVKDANFALSKEISSIMEKLKGTKAVPLSKREEDNYSTYNAIEEAIETLPSQPTNIVSNYF